MQEIIIASVSIKFLWLCFCNDFAWGLTKSVFSPNKKDYC